MDLKIGVISNYNQMQSSFKHLEDKFNCKLIFKMGVLDLAIDIALELEKEYKVDAIISNIATCEALKDFVSIPLVPMHLTNNNLISSFYNASKKGSHLVFADVAKEHPKYNFNYIKEILGYDIVHYTFNTPYDAPSIVERCLLEKKDVIVSTGICTLSLAKEKNIRTELVEFLESDMIDAIERAINITNVRRIELEKMQWLTSLVNNSSDGFIVVSDNNKIQIISKKASSLIGIDESNLLYQDLETLASKYVFFETTYNLKDEYEIINANSKELVVCKNNIYTENKFNGYLITISELNKIQNIELHARSKYKEKGFFAKYDFDDIKGNSTAIWNLKDKAKKYAKTNSNIVIYGESGCGKELFAQSIHNYSEYNNGNFVAINCAALPETLLESELFGYEEGAFSGAKKGGKQGLFELAHEGTLFLDEIGEIPMQLQSRLLRVLQEKTIRRIGGDKNIHVDVRIISATNRNLYDEVKLGKFRADLYYRVNVLSLNIPPLRERTEDIVILANEFIKRLNSSNNSSLEMPLNLMNRLKDYSWPGNARELNYFIERLWILSKGKKNIDNILFTQLMEELDDKTKNDQINNHANENDICISITNIKDMELSIIKHMLKKYNGNKNEVARVLGMSSTTLWRKIKMKKG